jgi:hypothetical protein
VICKKLSPQKKVLAFKGGTVYFSSYLCTMNTEGQTKINRLLQKQPSGALFFSSWMYENGISYELQTSIVFSK